MFQCAQRPVDHDILDRNGLPIDYLRPGWRNAMIGGLYDDERPAADAWVDRLPARYRRSLSHLSEGFAAGALDSSAAYPPTAAPAVVVGSAVGVPVLVSPPAADESLAALNEPAQTNAVADPSSVVGIPVGRPVLFHEPSRRSSRVAPAPLVTASSA